MRPDRAAADGGRGLTARGRRALGSIGLVGALLAATFQLSEAPPAGGQVSPAATTVAFLKNSTPVSGSYQPLVGNFGSGDPEDVFWYAPGSAQDFLWTGDTEHSFSGSPQAVSGTYQPFVGDFDGDGIDDIFWYRSSGRTSSGASTRQRFDRSRDHGQRLPTAGGQLRRRRRRRHLLVRGGHRA